MNFGNFKIPAKIHRDFLFFISNEFQRIFGQDFRIFMRVWGIKRELVNYCLMFGHEQNVTVPLSSSLVTTKNLQVTTEYFLTKD